jgi:uncharacterized protein (DUF305 family)
MKNVFRTTLAVAFAAGMGIGAGALVSAHDQEHHTVSKDSASGRMHAVMMAGQKDMPSMMTKMTGDPDHDFAMMMSHHHKMGINMAEIEVKDGKDAKMREMAQKIIDSQKKEIAEFEAWMKQHRPASGHASH